MGKAKPAKQSSCENKTIGLKNTCINPKTLKICETFKVLYGLGDFIKKLFAHFHKILVEIGQGLNAFVVIEQAVMFVWRVYVVAI